MLGALTSSRGAEFLKYTAFAILSSAFIMVLWTAVVPLNLHIRGDFYSAIAQVIPVLLLADLLLFTRSRRLLAEGVKLQKTVNELGEKSRELRLRESELRREHDALEQRSHELRLEAARAGAPLPPLPEPFDLEIEDPGTDDSDFRRRLESTAGAIDAAMAATFAWAVAGEIGALVALASGTSTNWTLALSGFGTVWLTLTLVVIELLAFWVPTDEGASGEFF